MHRVLILIVPLLLQTLNAGEAPPGIDPIQWTFQKARPPIKERLAGTEYASRFEKTIEAISNYKKTYPFLPDIGTRIMEVFPGSPAERLGLKASDFITKVDDVDVSSPQQFIQARSDEKPHLVTILNTESGARRQVRVESGKMGVRLDQRFSRIGILHIDPKVGTNYAQEVRVAAFSVNEDPQLAETAFFHALKKGLPVDAKSDFAAGYLCFCAMRYDDAMNYAQLALEGKPPFEPAIDLLRVAALRSYRLPVALDCLKKKPLDTPVILKALEPIVDSLKNLRAEQRLRVPPSSAASLLVPDPVLLRAKPSDSYVQFKAMNPESGPDLDRASKNASEYNRYLVRDGRISLDAPSGQYSFLTMKPGVKNVYIHARGFAVAFDTQQTKWQKSFVLGLQKPSLSGKTADSVLGFHLDSQGMAIRHMAPCFFPASMGSRSVPELAPRPGPHKAHDYELYMVDGDVELFVDGQRFFYGPAVNNDEPLEPHILVCGAQCELSQVVVLELLKPDEITESWRKEINKKFEWGNTRLHAMVSGCTVAQLTSLVAQGADIHAKNSDGDMPLHIAAINRREEVVKQLMSLGSKTDLRAAAALGDLATLKTLLGGEAKKELNLNTVSWTPLCGACWNGNTSTAALLLEGGADPNIPASSLFGKCYPLHMAVLINNEALVKLLLDKGAKLDVTNFRGQTPLMMAEAIVKSDSLVQLLRARGARNNGGKAVKPPAPPASEAPFEF